MPVTLQEESEDCLTEARLRGQSSQGLASWQQRRMYVSAEEKRCGTTCSFALRPLCNKRSVWRPRQELPGLALRQAVEVPVFHRPRREQSETESERLLVYNSWNLLLTAKQVQITKGTQPRNFQPTTGSIEVQAGNYCIISSLMQHLIPHRNGRFRAAGAPAEAVFPEAVLLSVRAACRSSTQMSNSSLRTSPLPTTETG
jgi:hypothetical protein